MWAIQPGPATARRDMPGGSAVSSLYSSLVAAYKFEEASGTRADATGRGNDLAPTNAPGNTTGENGNAALLVTASSQSLSHADTADLSIGTRDYTITFWINPTTVAGTQHIINKDNGTTLHEFVIRRNGTKIECYAWSNSVLSSVIQHTQVLSAGTWYFVEWSFTSATKVMSINVNNGTPVTTTLSTTRIDDSTNIFFVGSFNGASAFLGGAVDELYIWARTLTSGERATLAAGGAGAFYPFDGSLPGVAASAITVDTALPVAYTTTYDAATHGANGTDGTAYRSLTAALSYITSGGTITLRGGTHADLTSFTSGRQCCFSLTKAMTIQAYSGETPTITYPAGNPPVYDTNNFGPILYITASSIVLDGLTITGTQAAGDCAGGLDTDVNVDIAAAISGFTLRRCTIQNFGHAGIKFGTGGNGGALLIERNRFLGGGFTQRDHNIYAATGSAPPAFAYDTTIRFNEVTGAHGYGIHCYSDPQNVKIYGNIVHHNGDDPVNGGGILMAGTGNEVYNNTICDNIGYGGIVFWKQIAAYTNIVKNNIIRDNTTDVRLDASNGTNTVGQNNKHTISGSNYSPAGTDLDTDPLFTSASPATWTDYTLQAGSPMIAAGEAQSSPYDQGLDPAQTTTPTAKTQSSPPTIGGFTT